MNQIKIIFSVEDEKEAISIMKWREYLIVLEEFAAYLRQLTKYENSQTVYPIKDKFYEILEENNVSLI